MYSRDSQWNSQPYATLKIMVISYTATVQRTQPLTMNSHVGRNDIASFRDLPGSTITRIINPSSQTSPTGYHISNRPQSQWFQKLPNLFYPHQTKAPQTDHTTNIHLSISTNQKHSPSKIMGSKTSKPDHANESSKLDQQSTTTNLSTQEKHPSTNNTPQTPTTPITQSTPQKKRKYYSSGSDARKLGFLSGLGLCCFLCS